MQVTVVSRSWNTLVKVAWTKIKYIQDDPRLLEGSKDRISGEDFIDALFHLTNLEVMDFKFFPEDGDYLFDANRHFYRKFPKLKEFRNIHHDSVTCVVLYLKDMMEDRRNVQQVTTLDFQDSYFFMPYFKDLSMVAGTLKHIKLFHSHPDLIDGKECLQSLAKGLDSFSFHEGGIFKHHTKDHFQQMLNYFTGSKIVDDSTPSSYCIQRMTSFFSHLTKLSAPLDQVHLDCLPAATSIKILEQMSGEVLSLACLRSMPQLTHLRLTAENSKYDDDIAYFLENCSYNLKSLDVNWAPNDPLFYIASLHCTRLEVFTYRYSDLSPLYGWSFWSTIISFFPALKVLRMRQPEFPEFRNHILLMQMARPHLLIRETVQ
jgi:hypothetical protein